MRNRALLPLFEDLTARSDAGVRDTDFHMHSNTSDGRDTVEEMVSAARNAGLRSYALTEHVRRETTWFAAFAERCRDLRDGRLLVGAETKALDHAGTVDLPVDAERLADIVIGSVHRIPDEDGQIVEPASLAPRRALELEQMAALGLVRGGRIDVLAHPGGMYRRHGEYPRSLLAEIASEAARCGVVLEVNAKYHPDPGGLLRLFRERGALVSFGSDAHGCEEVGRILQLLSKSS